MKSTFVLLSSLCWVSLLHGQEKLMGFSEAASAKQVNWEKQFDAQLDPKNLDTWMQFLAARPHHAGSAKGKANADYMVDLFRQWGYQAELSTYHVLFPTPKTRILELLGPRPFRAKLEEPALQQDRTSAQKQEQLPTYNAYSADGDVTAELVYVNRGVPADYEELKRMGVSVKGKIVIAKYGGSWRGIKPKVAYEHGAIGCIIYSDPADDGYVQGDVYPEGSFRPEFGVQRGSVMDMPIHPGDPLTPGYASTKGARQIDRKEAITLMKIPVLPISYADALPLLQSLGGQVVPPSWKGGLPLTYHVGPSKEKVHLKLEFNWDIKPIHNVIAKMPGSEYPDQWIIRGNHHDAWVNGAADPLSGMTAVMEEARAIGVLAKNGFKPKRTLIYCAWDGEEQGLLGSTEWMEQHQQELSAKAVVYINTDASGRGFVGASGSHTLEPFFNQVMGDVQDPQTGVSIRERRYAKTMVDADRTVRAKTLGNRHYRISALGAGSDYSPFIQHLGISCIDLGFGGENAGGEYHSIYDSYDMFTRFKDPGFQYGITLAKTAGRITMRLANADALPFDFNSFYKTLTDYASEVKSLLDQLRSETETEKLMLKEKLFTIARDPKKINEAPDAGEDVPYLNFSPLDNALVQLKNLAEAFQKQYHGAAQLPLTVRNQLNELLYKAERSLTSANGLPRRPWYRHQIYAPGFYTGYGVKTLPAIREAVEQHNWKEAQEGIATVTHALLQYNEQVKKAVDLLGKTL